MGRTARKAATLQRVRRVTAPLPVDAKVKSAARVLQLLEYFDDMQRPLTVMDVVTNLGYPQSSTSDLLQTLTSLGYLDWDSATRTYLPSIRVSLLGRWIGSDCLSNGPALSLMDRLSEETGETIVLALRNGLYAQYIHVIQATRPAHDHAVHMALGSVRPLARSGSGYALLALMRDEDVGRIVRRINAGIKDAADLISLRELSAELANIRSRGYAQTHDLARQGSGIIAAPIPRLGNFPDMVVGVGAPSSRIVDDEAQLAHVLKSLIVEYLGSGGAY